MDPADRRRHPRLQMDGRMVGRATVMTDFRVSALSEAGGALEMEGPLPPGATLDLDLDLGRSSLALRGRVVDVQPPEGSRATYLVAVEFEGATGDELRRLGAYLREQREKDE